MFTKQLTAKFPVMALLAFACLSGTASAEDNKRTSEATSTTEQQLEQRVEALSEAMIAADSEKLRQLTAKELSYGHSSGRVEDQQTFIRNLENGSSDFVSIDLQDQTVSVVGDTGIVRHILVAKTNDSGKSGDVRIGVMLVWQKAEGQWELLARQAYKL